MKKCPRCSSELSVNDKICPKCRLEVGKMEEYIKSQGLSIEDFVEEKESVNKNELKAKTRLEKKIEKQKKKEAKKQAKKERKELESKSDTDFSVFASNTEENIEKSQKNKTFSDRKKLRKMKETTPQFELDENGEFDIDTKDVEIVGEKTGKIIEESMNRSYSVKKARGEYSQPKIKWWEIYKFADRSLARSKIKKEVNKAAIQKPSFINKSKLLLLAIFLGWTGAHNFYAKNKKKGWTSIITLILWLGITMLSSIPFFASISVSVGGCAGFINMFIWIGDIISICFNKFKYRIQKEKFIFGMNIETRAKLGEKYIDLELYQKPWWVRFKVWCQRQKEESLERKQARRQARIEKEKRKLAKKEEEQKIEKEIADFEEKQNDELKNQKDISKENIKNIIDKETLKDINSFDGGLTECKVEESKDEKKFVDNSKKAKKSFKTKNKKK